MLGDRQGDAGDVDLLEGIGADDRRGYLAGDGHDGRRVHIGRGQAGDQVGRAGARGGDADAHLAGGAGIAIGGVGRSLLVAHQDVVDRIVGQRVIEMDHRPPEMPKMVSTPSRTRLSQTICAPVSLIRLRSFQSDGLLAIV